MRKINKICVKGEWGNTKYIELVSLKADDCRHFVSLPLCTDGESWWLSRTCPVRENQAWADNITEPKTHMFNPWRRKKILIVQRLGGLNRS